MASEMSLENLQQEIECDQFSLAKWSPMASEINRDEFLGITFSHHMEILHKTKNIEEVLFCIHEAVVHQWDKYTLRDILLSCFYRFSPPTSFTFKISFT